MLQPAKQAFLFSAKDAIRFSLLATQSWSAFASFFSSPKSRPLATLSENSAGVCPRYLKILIFPVFIKKMSFIFKPAPEAPAPASPAGCPNDPQCKVKVSQVCGKLKKVVSL